MIDHLLYFVDRDSAVAALPALGSYVEDVWYWDGSIVLENIRAYVGDGDVLPGFRLWVTLPELDDGLPGLELAADPVAAEGGLPFIVFKALTDEQLQISRLSPVRFGTRYPFGHPV